MDRPGTSGRGGSDVKYPKKFLKYEKVIDEYNAKVAEIPEEIKNEVESMAKDRLIEAVRIKEKLLRYSTIDNIDEEVINIFEEREYKDDKETKLIINRLKIEGKKYFLTNNKIVHINIYVQLHNFNGGALRCK